MTAELGIYGADTYAIAVDGDLSPRVSCPLAPIIKAIVSRLRRRNYNAITLGTDYGCSGFSLSGNVSGIPG